MARVLVIGAGLFGCSVAIELATVSGLQIDLVEQNDDVMLEASMANHNRLHLGYHYLRSADTAKQSIEGLLTFLFYYGAAVRFNFPNYYAIAAEGSKSSPAEFESFCRVLGIQYRATSPGAELLDPSMIAACYLVPEPIFDFVALRKAVRERLHHEQINLMVKTTCIKLERGAKDLVAKVNGADVHYDFVVNCSYRNLNAFNAQLGVPSIPITLQDVLIPHFLYPREPFGLTVMDGPFCSVMPKGFDKNEFLLYHVTHSVLAKGFDHAAPMPKVRADQLAEPYAASMNYFPFLKDAKNFGHWRATRAVIDNVHDLRRTEIYRSAEVPNYFCVFSGKISTCLTTSSHLREIIQSAV